MSPIAAYRTILPAGDTAEQLSPVPQTTPTPQGRSVPARSTANVSFRSTSRSVQRSERIVRRRRRSSTGRSAPARQNTATSAIGDAPGRMPAALQARPTVAASSANDSSWSPGEKLAPPPRAAPSTRPPRLSSTASSFELPPSTARMAAPALGNLVHPHQIRALLPEVVDQVANDGGRDVGPAVHQHDGAVPVHAQPVE